MADDQRAGQHHFWKPCEGVWGEVHPLTPCRYSPSNRITIRAGTPPWLAPILCALVDHRSSSTAAVFKSHETNKTCRKFASEKFTGEETCGWELRLWATLFATYAVLGLALNALSWTQTVPSNRFLEAIRWLRRANNIGGGVAWPLYASQIWFSDKGCAEDAPHLRDLTLAFLVLCYAGWVLTLFGLLVGLGLTATAAAAAEGRPLGGSGGAGCRPSLAAPPSLPPAVSAPSSHGSDHPL